jgi:hypothetical protein
MSYPSSVLNRGSFKSSRDVRDTNIRIKCPFCPRDNLLFTSYGPHILKCHQDELFSLDKKDCELNRKYLQKKKVLTSPLELNLGTDCDEYACLGCSTVFKKLATAENHFEKKKEICGKKHQENILQLKDKYPLTMTPTAVPALKSKAKLELMIDNLLERVRSLEAGNKHERYDYEQEFGAYFEDWGMDLREETLKENWALSSPETAPEPEPLPEPEVPKAPVLDTSEDDEILLVEPRRLTKEEVMRNTFTPAMIKEMATSVRTGEVDPAIKAELEALYSKPVAPPAPVPEPAKPSFTKAEMEATLAEMEAFQKMTPQQRFLKANPELAALPVQEQFRMMSTFVPAQSSEPSPYRIVQNTKLKRPIKAC